MRVNYDRIFILGWTVPLMLDLLHLLSSPDVNWWTGVIFLSDSHSDGTHSLQSIHWLSFWRHPFTAEHPLTLILTAPIHCRASMDSHSDGTHSLQSIHGLSFWRHPFTAEHPLTLILMAPIHCRASMDSHSDGTHALQSIHWLSFWRHPFTAEHPLTLILMAPIHCRASKNVPFKGTQTVLLDSQSDGTHSLQNIHWLSVWRYPFTAEHSLTLILTAPIHCRASIAETLMQRRISPNLTQLPQNTVSALSNCYQTMFLSLFCVHIRDITDIWFTRLPVLCRRILFS